MVAEARSPFCRAAPPAPSNMVEKVWKNGAKGSFISGPGRAFGELDRYEVREKCTPGPGLHSTCETPPPLVSCGCWFAQGL